MKSQLYIYIYTYGFIRYRKYDAIYIIPWDELYQFFIASKTSCFFSLHKLIDQIRINWIQQYAVTCNNSDEIR